MRRHEDVELLVRANFCGRPVTVELPDTARRQGSELLLCNVPEPGPLAAQLTLAP